MIRIFGFLITALILFSSQMSRAQETYNLCDFEGAKMTIESKQQFNEARQLLRKADSVKIAEIRAGAIEIPSPACFESMLAWAENNESRDVLLEVQWSLFNNYYLNNMHFKSLYLGEALLPQLIDNHQILARQTLDALINIYNQQEAYQEVLRLLTYKQQDFYKHSNKKLMGSTYREELGMTYYRMGFYDEAVKYFTEQAPFFKNIKNQLMASSMYNNTGLSFFNLKNTDSALYYYKKAILELGVKPAINPPYADEVYVVQFENIINANIAEVYLERGDVEKALPLFLKEVKENTGERRILMNAYFKVAKAFYKKGDLTIAKKYIDSSIQAQDLFLTVKNNIDIINLQAKIAFLEGDIDSGEHYFDLGEKLKDSIDLLNTTRRASIAAAKFNLEQKDQELMATKYEIEASEKRNTFLWIIVLISLVFFIILGYFFMRSKKDNRIIKEQSIGIRESLKEKDILLKEIHHRVKNNLQVISSLLQLQSKKANSLQMSNALDDSQRHIHSMALVHQMLYQQDDYAVIPMREYLKKLVKQILYSLIGKHLDTHVDISDVELSIDKAIPLGLLLSELMTNTNKHAFDDIQGDIWVSLSSVANKSSAIDSKPTYQFTYRDNGKGLMPDYKTELSKTMGFRLIYMLAEEMDAEITVEGNKGVKVTLEFQD